VEGDAVDAVVVGDAVDELQVAVRRAGVAHPAIAEAAGPEVAHGDADEADVLRGAARDPAAAGALEDRQLALVGAKGDPSAGISGAREVDRAVVGPASDIDGV